jgi:phosphate transport system substrate-binding protein
MYRLLLIPAFLALVACGSNEQDAPSDVSSTLKGTVRVDGSSTVFPISEAVAEEYRAVQPRVRINVGVSGTGGGFKKLINKEIDINNASREIKASEMEKLTAGNINFIELPIAFDGLSVVVNKNNDWVDHLTTDELKKIWQPESVVETWQDVRPEWPAEEIKLYGPGADSGTFDYFTKAINGKEQASRADYTSSEDDNVLVKGISGDLYSLGYFGFAYYKENASKLRVVPVDGGDGPTLPTLETISSGSYKPLSRPVYIYVKEAALAETQVQDFVDFYLTHAGKLAEEVGYISMPEQVYARAKDRVANRETGSYYHGQVANLTKDAQ